MNKNILKLIDYLLNIINYIGDSIFINQNKCEHRFVAYDNPRIYNDCFNEFVKIKYDVFCEDCNKKIKTKIIKYKK